MEGQADDEEESDGVAVSTRPGRRVAAAAVLLAIVIALVTCFATGLIPGPSSGAGASLAARSTAGSTEPTGCWSVPMKLAVVTHNPDGSTVYHWTGDGTWSDQTVPAPGFNPLTATKAELIANGFPPRPPSDNPVALKAWEVAMEHAKTTEVSHPVMEVGSGCPHYGGPEEAITQS